MRGKDRRMASRDEALVQLEERGVKVIRLGRDSEFERAWQEQRERERTFVARFLAGEFSDEHAVARGRDEGEDLRCLGDTSDIVFDELERLNVAVLVHMGALNQGNALRLVRSGGHNALGNTGFAYENEFFRLAAYDWSDDEDEDGNPVRRHDFEVKPAGNHMDWYKWARRDDWLSPGLAEAFDAAEDEGIPVGEWLGSVVDRCIDSLMSSRDLSISETEPCPWRRPDPSRVPKTFVAVDACLAGPEMTAVTMNHPNDGYTGFVLAEDTIDESTLADVTSLMPEVAAEVAMALRKKSGDPLAQSAHARIDAPDDLGYIKTGEVWLQRVFRMP